MRRSSDIDLAAHPAWLHWLPTCLSTNTWALEHRQNLAHGSVVYTPLQTAGRGQQGRSWQALTGVLTTSLVLDLPAAQLTGLSLVAGLAVINAVEDLMPELAGKLRLKWPNDVVVGQRKLAGILCEAVTRSSDQPVRVVVGIGLNCSANFAETPLAAKAMSLSDLAMQIPTDLELLSALRRTLLPLVEASEEMGLAAALRKYESRDALAGCMLTFAPAENLPWLVGQGAGLGPQGELLIQDQTGAVRAFASGRVMAWG